MHPEADDAIGVGIGKWPQQNTAYHREHRRRRPNAECQRQKRDGCEASPVGQLPKGQADISGDAFEGYCHAAF
jgi:hypothetical protein